MRTPLGQKKFGRFLRLQREKLGLGLREAARTVGMSDTYLGALEHGQPASPPSEKILRGMAKTLQVDVDFLFCAAGRVPAVVCRWLLSDEKRLRTVHRSASAAHKKKLRE